MRIEERGSLVVGQQSEIMKPKILTWNVRGLNEGNKHLRIRNLLQD
jgi:hypothetical protein